MASLWLQLNPHGDVCFPSSRSALDVQGFHWFPFFSLTSFLDSSLTRLPPSSLSPHVPASSEGFSLTATLQRGLLIRRVKRASAGFDASQVPQKRDRGFLIITTEL